MFEKVGCVEVVRVALMELPNRAYELLLVQHLRAQQRPCVIVTELANSNKSPCVAPELPAKGSRGLSVHKYCGDQYLTSDT